MTAAAVMVLALHYYCVALPPPTYPFQALVEEDEEGAAMLERRLC